MVDGAIPRPPALVSFLSLGGISPHLLWLSLPRSLALSLCRSIFVCACVCVSVSVCESVSLSPRRARFSWSADAVARTVVHRRHTNKLAASEL